jgi:hypothetical protein
LTPTTSSNSASATYRTSPPSDSAPSDENQPRKRWKEHPGLDMVGLVLHAAQFAAPCERARRRTSILNLHLAPACGRARTTTSISILTIHRRTTYNAPPPGDDGRCPPTTTRRRPLDSTPSSTPLRTRRALDRGTSSRTCPGSDRSSSSPPSPTEPGCVQCCVSLHALTCTPEGREHAGVWLSREGGWATGGRVGVMRWPTDRTDVA